MPTVLLYNLDSEKGRKIRALCLVMKLRSRRVAREEYGLPLTALLGEQPPEVQPPEVQPPEVQPLEVQPLEVQPLEVQPPPEEPPGDFQEEMLVMAGFSQSLMESFLRAFPRKKIAPVALKAVVTPANREWDSLRLYHELAAERQAMEERKKEKEQTP